MTDRDPLPPLSGLHTLPVESLGARLAEAGYDEAVLGIAEGVAPGHLDPLRLPLVHQELESRREPRFTLALLLAYDAVVPRDAVRDALGSEWTGRLEDAGLMESAGEQRLRARFRLLPVDGLYLLSDDLMKGGACVMGPAPTTLQLLRLLPEAASGAFCDVGCGAGTLALAAAMRGYDAIGVDLNPRAVEMARWNARLNGLDVEFRAGDLLEPLRGARFDALYAQPPFVVQPEGDAAVLYLHGGARGDELALRLIEGVDAALRPGGEARILVDAPVLSESTLHARIAERAQGLDLLLLAAPGATPDQQAIAYGYEAARGLGVGYGAAARRYRAHIQGMPARAFHHALVLLRAPLEPRACLSAQLAVRRIPGGEAVQGLWRALDLSLAPGDALERACVRLGAGGRWTEERTRPGAEPTCYLRFGPGSVAQDFELPAVAGELLALLEASPTVGDAVERYAEYLETTVDEARPTVLDFLREGLRRGLLEER